MAVIKGVKEVIHLPLYDSISIRPKEQFRQTQSSNILRFFLDVTGKNKLQTNMQAASILPHWNTFEARALRVVISDLPAQFPENDMLTKQVCCGVYICDEKNKEKPVLEPKDGNQPPKQKTVKLNFRLRHLVDFTRRLEEYPDLPIRLKQDDLDCLGLTNNQNLMEPDNQNRLAPEEFIIIDRCKLMNVAGEFPKEVLPPQEQLVPHNGFGTLIGKLIYNSITTFFVGEKIMIQVPTWFFPAGGGPYAENGQVTTHGYPNPEATFRFATAVTIDAQQNFRVEIEIPENEVLSDIQRIYGPFYIWVVVDGFMTRDVQ
ncbi:MAG: hypothetical protein ACU84H_17065 [Gammaproteobacteria bacterium]